MRVFVGIGLDENMKDAIFRAAMQAQKLFPGRYAIRDNYHCTLQFIGETGEESVSVIEKAMANASEGIMPFPIRLSALSFFRNPRSAILFCRLHPSGPLQTLARELRKELNQSCFSLDDASFHPHITLARQARIMPDRLSGIAVAEAEGLVQKVTLFESARVGEQLRYMPLLHCPLGK